MEHTLYQSQRGAAQEDGRVDIQSKTQKTLFGIKIKKVEGFNPRWQLGSIAIISASHTVSRHRKETTSLPFHGRKEPTASLRLRMSAVQVDLGREASTGTIMIFSTRINIGVYYQMAATVMTLPSIIAVAVMVITLLQ